MLVWAVASAFLTGTATLLLTPLIIKAAYAFEWVDFPQANRWHGTPTALMGGVAMYGAGTVAMILLVPFVETGAGLGVVWGGATVLFVAGVVDDLRGIGPAAKITAQAVAAGLLIYAGHAFGAGWPLWISGPLTLVWVLGITNAVNLLDNMDGLAAGIAGISVVALIILAAAGGSLGAGILGGIVGGAALAFLWFNAKPARIFMGDCGSLVLGYTVAALAVMGQGALEGGAGVAVLASICALAVPILDTTIVTVTRLRAGRPVTNGGRDHMSHRLVSLGLSERAAVGTLYSLGACVAGLGLTALLVEPMLFYALCALGTVALSVLGRSLGRLDVYHRSGVGGDGAPTSRANTPSTSRDRWGARRKVALGLVGDGLLVGGAFAAAYALAGQGGLPGVADVPIVEGLLLVGGTKLAVFYAMGLYRRLWRHAGTPEVVRIVGSTLLAEGAAGGGLALVYGLGALSAPLLMIDWLVLTLGLIGSRLGFRGLRRGLAVYNSHAAPSESASHVLLCGAGERGMLALRAIRDAEGSDRVPVGFIDPDFSKQEQTVQGLPVLGGINACAELCRTYDIDEVIVATDDSFPHYEREVFRQCEEVGVECRSFDVRLEPLRIRHEADRAEPVHGPAA